MGNEYTRAVDGRLPAMSLNVHNSQRHNQIKVQASGLCAFSSSGIFLRTSVNKMTRLIRYFKYYEH